MRPRTTSMSTLYPGSELTPDQVEFARAIDRYKREEHRPYPSWAEVLAVAKSLGYRKPEGNG